MLVAVFGVGEAAVEPAEGQHEAELVELPHALEERDERVLIQVPRQLGDVHLGARGRRAAHPPCRHTDVVSEHRPPGPPPPGSTMPSCWHPPGGGPPYRLCPFTCTRSMPVSLTQASRAILLVRLMLLVHC